MYKTSVILCGGKGSRLGELGKDIPKTLLKVQGKPIIWYILMTKGGKTKIINISVFK